MILPLSRRRDLDARLKAILQVSAKATSTFLNSRYNSLASQPKLLRNIRCGMVAFWGNCESFFARDQ
jgi:hypothetical protein